MMLVVGVAACGDDDDGVHYDVPVESSTDTSASVTREFVGNNTWYVKYNTSDGIISCLVLDKSSNIDNRAGGIDCDWESRR